MDCPKCVGKLKKKSIEGVEIDVCLVCEGIWFGQFVKDEAKIVMNFAPSKWLITIECRRRRTRGFCFRKKGNYVAG